MKEILKEGKVEENVYFLPDMQIERKLYLDIAKHLTFLGGKWNRGKKGFVFDRKITLDEIVSYNNDMKKEIQFFETPEKLSDYLVEKAEVKSGDSILEPSAGRGAIIKSIRKILPEKEIQYCEIDATNMKYLAEIENIENVQDTGNFLEFESMTFDKIIANPPFSKNQDIEHIRHMYSMLRNKGRLVSIASKHWQLSNNKKETAFREFLDETNASVEEIDAGEFKESGTQIATVLVTINKQNGKYT